MEKKEEEGENHLLVACWPEPFAFAYTKEEEKSYKSFSFTEEGLEEARSVFNGRMGKAERVKKEIIGVIGGIASGKSTVLSILQGDYSYRILRMDELAKDIIPRRSCFKRNEKAFA